MSTIDSVLPEHLVQTPAAISPEKKNELGQDEFLKLMLAQLEHQDPFKPLENGEFVAQMAQFSTVAGIENMDNSLSDMSTSFAGNQLLQASSLIGRTALVPSANAKLNEDLTIKGFYKLPESTPGLSFDVYSDAGELVHHSEYAEKGIGTHPFEWNGVLKDGSRAPSGNYTLSITYGLPDDQTQAETLVENKIATITLPKGDSSITFETEEGSTVRLLDIEQLK